MATFPSVHFDFNKGFNILFSDKKMINHDHLS